MSGRTMGDDNGANQTVSEYIPGGNAQTGPVSSRLSITAKQPAVNAATGSWAAVSAIMDRSENNLVTRVMPALRPADPPDIERLIGDNTLLDACKIEFDRISRELDELRLLTKQAGKELEKLNQRKVLAAAEVRQIEERMEHHSRQEIRNAYLAASEAEMRAFMIAEQREQLETKLRVYERYGVFLGHTIASLEEAYTQEAPQSPYPYIDAGPWNVPTAGPAFGPAGLPSLYPGHTPAAMPFEPSGPVPGHDLATIGRVINAQESVRQRVAQQLHDGPTQSLANIVLAAEVFEKVINSDPRRAISELANLKALVNTTLQETRKFIFELRPMTLDDLGLAATLHRYAADISAHHDIQAQVSAPYAEQNVPKHLEVPVFRVAQEAIMNAVEHSRATIIQVTLAVTLEGLMLVVADNGGGFDVEDALARARERQTSGISNMQDRAELLGGWLRIESIPSRGSRVELAVPLTAAR